VLVLVLVLVIEVDAPPSRKIRSKIMIRSRRIASSLEMLGTAVLSLPPHFEKFSPA